LNNGGGAAKQTALHRLVGSIAFAAAARAAFMVVQDPDDEENRLFLHVKNNLGPRCPGLSFRLQQSELADGVQTSKVTWGSEHIAQNADDALAAAEGHNAESTIKSAAIGFLRTILANGPMLVLDVQRHAIDAGLLQEGKLLAQSKPFRSAGKTLGINHKREMRVGGGWILELPEKSKMPSVDNDAQLPATDTIVEGVPLLPPVELTDPTFPESSLNPSETP
jgi:putative DNA primase/helicase